MRWLNQKEKKTMEINRYEIADVLGALPNLQPLAINDRVDIFICTLGFEDRTHSVIDKYTSSGHSNVKTIVVIEYPTNKEDNAKNISYFEKAAAKLSSLLVRIEYSRKSFLQDLTDKIGSLCDNNCSVLFDISTCSSYVFYPVMKMLYRSSISLQIVYAEAAKYYPTYDEWAEVNKKAEIEKTLFTESFENANFQSTGVDDIYVYNAFFEVNPGNKPCALIAVPNFSCKRMNAIVARDGELNKTKYDDIVWLIGKPPADHNEWRVDAVIKTNNLYNRAPNTIKPVSTIDYKEMMMTLEGVWSDYRYKYHLTIGSLGSKNQHLGSFFFLALHQDVGLWLAEPKEFRANRFSEGEGVCWQIDMGSMDVIRGRFSQYQTFRWKL
jgi:hypothetical protein